MPRQHVARSGRTRGSWTPRLAGIGAALLIAGGGALAYVIVSPAHASRGGGPLPTRVVSVQTVGIVARAAGSSTRQLTDSPTGLRWVAMPPGGEQGNSQWSADTMAGGTFVFIYAPTGQCLASVTHRHQIVLGLRRCDLGATQRWRRISYAVQSQGHQYGQYRALGSGRCLTAAGGEAAAVALEPCSRSRPAEQLISFWWTA